ncbi:MAG: FkbM family methyltransferase [Chloroflexota bacterium]
MARRVTRRIRSSRYHALNELDTKLESYLDIDGGFFVEAGANDGIDQSNTAYFERRRGWSGVLIEPIPRLAEQCRANRPRSIVIETALVESDFPLSTIEMTDCGLMSSVMGAMRDETARAEHLRVGAEIQGLSPVNLVVRARTLDSILDQVKPDRFDLLSLDVEGFELQVLRGIDLHRWAPKFVLVEARFRDEIDTHMLGTGYKMIEELSHHDVLYRRGDLTRTFTPTENAP